MSDADVITVRQAIAQTILSVEPSDQTQRQAFAALMPDLYVLRRRGFGFAQLTELLNTYNFKLKKSTVRTYYQEMLASKMELCEARFDKQLATLAKIEELTGEEQVAAIAAKIVGMKV